MVSVESAKLGKKNYMPVIALRYVGLKEPVIYSVLATAWLVLQIKIW